MASGSSLKSPWSIRSYSDWLSSPSSLGNTSGNHPNLPKSTESSPREPRSTETPSRRRAAACLSVLPGPLGEIVAFALITRCLQYQKAAFWMIALTPTMARCCCESDGRYPRQRLASASNRLLPGLQEVNQVIPRSSQAALTEGTGLLHDHGSAMGHALWDTLETHVYPADVQCDRSLSHVRTESASLVGDIDCTFVCAYFLNSAVDCIEPPLCLIRSSHKKEDLIFNINVHL